MGFESEIEKSKTTSEESQKSAMSVNIMESSKDKSIDIEPDLAKKRTSSIIEAASGLKCFTEHLMKTPDDSSKANELGEGELHVINSESNIETHRSTSIIEVKPEQLGDIKGYSQDTKSESISDVESLNEPQETSKELGVKQRSSSIIMVDEDT